MRQAMSRIGASGARRCVDRAAAVLAVAVLVAAAHAAPAQAHAYVEDSDPRDGAVLAAPPAEVRVTYTEPVEPHVTRLTLLGPDGKPVRGTEQVARGDLVLVLRLPPLPPGTYVVRTDTLGKDGHPTREEIRFTVSGPAPPAGTGEARPTPDQTPSARQRIAPPPAPRPAPGRAEEDRGMRTEIFTNMAVMAVAALVVGGAVTAILYAASRKR